MQCSEECSQVFVRVFYFAWKLLSAIYKFSFIHSFKSFCSYSSGLQSKCCSAFAQLASTSCIREDVRVSTVGPGDAKSSLKAAVLRERPRPVRLHATHVLSMDVMMTTGLEVGSHAADCWKHVFRY